MDVVIDEFREDTQGLDDAPNELFNRRVGGGWDVTFTLPDG
jgi:hypothetical protein